MNSFASPLRAAQPVLMTALLFGGTVSAEAQNSFNRIASFPVFENSDIANETAAEIVAASTDGNTLVYTDSPLEVVGFVDITNPAAPAAAGAVDVGGEPTSVGVAGNFALVAVNTSVDFINPSGNLKVFDIATRSLVRTIDLGGQPDAVAVSPDGNYAAIAIENERDEDFTPPGGEEGDLPQLPAGFLVIVNLSADPTNPSSWTTNTVDLTGLSGVTSPEDPEPEYVDINTLNQVAVSLQENNALVLVDAPSATIIGSFSAGAVDLTEIDATEEDPALISLTESLSAVPREPDGLSWINDQVFVTADEGDWLGGSRGFTLFDTGGNVLFRSSNTLEHEVVRLGHYPDSRSGNKGNEPENAEYGNFGGSEYLFVGSERSSVIFVYGLSGSGTNVSPTLTQTLPAGGLGPEGLLAIPGRNLFVAASEEDSRDDTFRSVISIYQLQAGPPNYPDIVSVDRTDGTPIPWGALSALAADPTDSDTAYTVYDSYYQQSRVFTLDISTDPATIIAETPILDSNGILANVQNNVLDARDDTTPIEITLVNPDRTVNLDPEGIAIAPNGNFWIASEGDDNPFFPNMLIEANRAGTIVKVVLLPDTTRALIDNNGFEGVAVAGRFVYAAFQRDQWDGVANRVRIGRYDTTTGQWSFFFYPTETPSSPNGGWVGLSELTYVGNETFLVIERDNQAGADAALKAIYQFNISGITPLSDDAAPNFPVIEKTLVTDLMPQLGATGGRILEKVEGLALLSDGDLLYVIDNDGTDDSNGETPLLRTRAMASPLVTDVLVDRAGGTVSVIGQNLTEDIVLLIDGTQQTGTLQPDGSLVFPIPVGLEGIVPISVQSAGGAVLASTRATFSNGSDATPVPALSVWGMLILLALLMASGGRATSRRG